DVGRIELEPGRGRVLLEIAPTLRTGDRHEAPGLREQPGERDLSGHRALVRCDFSHDRGGAHVRLEVFALKARITATIVPLWVLVAALHVTGEKAPTEGTERHEPDAELTERRDDPSLEAALPERILALQRGDRMHRVRPTDRLLARLRETEEPHFALAHELGHG